MKLAGYQAIEAKEKDPAIILGKHNDPTEDARENISIDEAWQIAKEDPSLIWAIDWEKALHDSATDFGRVAFSIQRLEGAATAMREANREHADRITNAETAILSRI